MVPEPSTPYNNCLMSYIYLAGYFSPDECEKLRNLPYPIETAHIQRGNNQSEISLYHRNTLLQTVFAAPETEWIYNRVARTIATVNAQYYHFEIERLTPIQVLQYQPGGFFTEHYDIGQGELSRRKLTMLIFLSPSTDYTGGKLIFFPEYPPLNQDIGDVLLFPSYMLHEVQPVHEGVRYTLVAWSEGPCFQ